MTESFWAIPNIEEIRTPVTILKEQADALTQATEGLLKGEVISFTQESVSGSEMLNVLAFLQKGFKGGSRLAIVVPFLKNYRVNLLDYYHNITMYPGTLDANFSDNREIKVQNEEQFVAALKNILSSEKTKMIVAGLISQAKAA